MFEREALWRHVLRSNAGFPGVYAAGGVRLRSSPQENSVEKATMLLSRMSGSLKEGSFLFGFWKGSEEDG